MELAQWEYGESHKMVYDTKGYYTYTDQGKMIDVMMGNSAYMWGYSYAPLKDAIMQQLDSVQFLRGRRSETCELVQEVNNRLLTMSGCDIILWSVSGSDCVEAGLEMAWQYWDVVNNTRKRVVGLFPGYSGITYIEKCLRGYRQAEYVSKPVHAPEWVTYEDRQAEEDKTYNQLKELFETDSSIGTVVLESMPWVAGVHPWSNTWWPRVRQLCDQYNVLLLLDDVFGCFGKIGSEMSHLDFGIQPDIIALGKSITGGYIPSGCALAVKKVGDVITSKDWDHGHTWHPQMLGVAATKAVLDIYDASKVKDIQSKHVDLMNRLKQEGLIYDYRGTGAIHEMIFFNDYDPALLDRVGITTNQIYRATMGIITPFVADEEYWFELEKRVRLLLSR